MCNNYEDNNEYYPQDNCSIKKCNHAKKTCNDTIDCCIPFTLIDSVNFEEGQVISSLHSINFNGLSVKLIGKTLAISGNIVATFIMNGIPANIIFPVNYVKFVSEKCINKCNPKIVIKDYSYNTIVDGIAVVLIVNGLVVTSHTECE